MTRNLELNVSSHSNDGGLRAAAREVDRLARAADDLAGEFRQAERAAGSLDRKLAETTAAAALLAKEFHKTGDSGIKKELDAQRSAASELKRLRADVVNDAEKNSRLATKAFESATRDFEKLAKKAGKDSATIFENGFIEGIKDPKLIAIGGTIGALLAIPIGAAIGGAVLAGAGAGAAGLAAFAATKADANGKIAAAGADLLSTVNQQISSGGATAIKPLLDGIHELKAALQDIHLDRIIESASKFIQPLAAGAARFATYLSQGIQHLVDAGGPAVKVLAEELPALGRAIKSAFDSIAAGGEGGARALQDTLRAVESFIITTGRLIGFLEEAYGALRAFGDGFESVLNKIGDFANKLVAIGGQTRGVGLAIEALVGPTTALLSFFDTGKEQAAQFGHSLSGASKDAAVLADQAAKTAEEITSISTAFTNLGQSSAGALTNQILQSMFSLDEATLHFQESLNGLTDAVKQNGTSLQGNSEKALRNKEALLAAAEANASLYAQNLLAGDSAQVAGQKYEVNAAQLRKQAIAAGYNATQVDALIGKYGAVPARVQTILATIGLTEALNRLGQILIDFRNLDGRAFASKYTVTYVTNHVSTFSSSGNLKTGQSRLGGGMALGGMRKAAAGMFIPSRAPGTVLVGEPQTAPGEMLIPLGGLTRQRAMSLTKPIGDAYGFNVATRTPSTPNWGGTGGSQAITVTLNLAGSDTAFGTALHRLVRAGTVQLRAVDSSGNSLPVKVV